RVPIQYNLDRKRFSQFCLLGGGFFNYGLGFLSKIPSLSAAIEKGGAVWLLGGMLGLRSGPARGDVLRMVLGSSALMVYAILVLLLAGFLSYGTAAIIIVAASVAVSTVRTSRVILAGAIASFLSVTLFTNYFAHRDDIRNAVWAGAPMLQRIDA